MNKYIQIFSIIIASIIVLLIISPINKSKNKTETFDNVQIEQQIIEIYIDILKRQPSSKELIETTQKIKKGTLTYDGLKQRLIDTPEYKRLIKLQVNELTPELPKVISDRDMLDKISKIYTQETGGTIPPEMLLPMRDAYLKLDYNEYALRAMLRDPNFKSFEEQIKSTPEMNNEKFTELFVKKFDGNNLQEKGMQIYKDTEKSGIPGASPTESIYRNIYDRDSDLTPTLKQINSSKNNIKMNDNTLYSLSQTEVTHDPTMIASTPASIPTHKGDMVLIPELAWSVPNYRAPVCTSLNKPQIVQPVLENSPLLLGTPLTDASTATSVGSILPQFEYKEYIPNK